MIVNKRSIFAYVVYLNTTIVILFTEFNNLVDHPHKPRFRFRRAGVRVPEYNIDVLVVVDYLVFRE